MYFFYRNKAKGATFPHAYITHDGNSIKVRLNLSRPLKVKAGQYIGLWMPTFGFSSFLQSHPFTVTSWSEGEQYYLDLFIEPRKGLTQKLLTRSHAYQKLLEERGTNEKLEDGTAIPNSSLSCLAFFSGPHGTSIPVGDYETVLLIASGFGIASQLPYLKQLIYGYNACKTRNRRVHLVWQLETLGKPQLD